MLDDYLSLGGIELGNNARAYDYASCLSCCVGLLKTPGCDGLHDATTGFTNAVREWQTQFTNLVTNPSMEHTDALTREVRRNLIPYSDTTSAAGWTPTSGALVSEGGRLKYTQDTTSPNRLGGETVTLGAKGSGTYIASFRAQTTTPTITAVRVSLFDSATATFRGSVTVPLVSGGADNLYFFDLTATGDFDTVYMESVGEPIAAGAVLFISQPLLELGHRRRPFFTGSFSPDADLTPSWTEDVGASESILSGANVSGIDTTVSGSQLYQSSVWAQSGITSLIIDPTGVTDASYGSISITGLTPGQTYTAIASIHLETPQAGSLHSTWQRQIMARSAGMVPNDVLSIRAPNEPGTYEVRVTFTLAASGSVALFFLNGSSATPVWFDDLALVRGEYTGPYFDGRDQPDGLDIETWRSLWDGGEDESTSVLQEYLVLEPAESATPPYSCDNITYAPWYDQSNRFSGEFAGFYLLSVRGITDGTMTAGVTESLGYGGVVGATHYATRSVRVRSMLVGCGNAATEYGLAWLKAALGESFCSRHGDACGTSDLAFFIDCPPPLDPGETDYDAAVAPYRRYLHDVACTSAPIIAEEYETPSGAYVMIVEYILTAESPFVWGEFFSADSAGVLTAYDDIPFNLMRRPSGEESDSIPAVVATQYAFNGSAEYGGSGTVLPTGWVRAAANISAGLSDAKSSDIAAVGPNSARVRLLATGSVSAGTIRLYYDVSLSSLPAGSAPSVSLWAAALIFAGSPDLDSIIAEVEWRTSTATVSTATLGQIPVNGGNISAAGLTPPPTATVARLAVTLPITSAVSGDDIRLYADAFGLTVP